MASASSLLEDIDDKFCQCCLCFDQYKDPRQLPCLHRYCFECVQKAISGNKDTFNCPLCQETVDIPENGAKGLKKDFYMNEILEYLQVKKSLNDTKPHTCGDCSKQVAASAYCFKCSGFLCTGCHEYHMTRKSLVEHRPHILTLENIASKNITLEKLSSLQEAPRCQTHLDNVSHLCCVTCRNLPICLACTYGFHSSHEIKDVTYLAEIERNRLKATLNALNSCKEEVYKMVEEIETVKSEIVAKADAKSDEIRRVYKLKVESYETQMDDIILRRKIKEEEIKGELSYKRTTLKNELEEKIKQLREEYGNLEAQAIRESDLKLGECSERYGKVEESVKCAKDKLETNFDCVSTLMDQEKIEKIDEAEKISQQVRNTISRFENLTATSSNVLEYKNDWTAVQNIDGICQAAEPLERDMKKEFLDMEGLLIFTKSDEKMVKFRRKRNVKISEHVEAVRHIVDTPGLYQYIGGITCTGKGDIVTSGFAGDRTAYISVITIEGETLKQETCMPRINRNSICTAHKTHNVVIVCKDKIGVFDTRDSSYYETSLSLTIGSASNWFVATCVTSEERNHNVIVGGKDDNLYILNEHLKFDRKLKLPEGMRTPSGIIVRDGHIIVCDSGVNRACVINKMDGEVVHEFTKPMEDNCGTPFGVCRDKNGYAYILWGSVINSYSDSLYAVAQYGPDDYEILDERSFTTNASSMTTAVIGDTEKLLISAFTDGKMNIFGLYEED